MLNTFHFHENGHPHLQVVFFFSFAIVDTVQSFSRFFFSSMPWSQSEACFLVQILTWDPAFTEHFLRKAGSGNVPSSPFTRLFWLLAPGSPYCSNQCSLAQWLFFSLLVTDLVCFLSWSSHESFLNCVPCTPIERWQICRYSFFCFFFFFFGLPFFCHSLLAHSMASCISGGMPDKKAPPNSNRLL